MIRKMLLGIMVFLVVLMSISLVSAQSPSDKIIDDIDKKTDKIIENILTSNTKIDIHGTEYEVRDNATVFLQLTCEFLPILNGTCLLTSYYPDKTIFINRTLMTFIPNSDGIYYYDFIAPNITGVYIMSAVCEFPFVITDEVAFDYVLDYGTDSGVVSDTWFFDDNFHEITEARVGAGQPWMFNITYKIDTSGINISKLYAITVETITDFHRSGYSAQLANENAYVKLWNFTSGSWVILDNQIPASPKDANAQTINFLCSGTDPILNMSDFVNSTTNELWVGISDVNQLETTQKDKLRVNLLNVEFRETDETPIAVRGSGEAHISPAFAENVYDTFWLLGDPNERLVSNHDYCYNNMTLIKEITTEKCLDSSCRTFQELRNITCDYGCINVTVDSGECRPSPIIASLIIIGIILLMAVLFAIAWWWSKRKI